MGRRFEVSPGGGLLMLSGDLDLASAEVFQAALDEVIPAGGPVILDMTDLDFLDSTGIRLIVSASRRLPAGCLVIHGAHGSVANVIELTGISRKDNIHFTACDFGIEDREST